MTFVVPDACTLPTAEQPVRLAEFDALSAFVSAVTGVSPLHARLVISGGPGLAAVRDLATRERSSATSP